MKFSEWRGNVLDDATSRVARSLIETVGHGGTPKATPSSLRRQHEIQVHVKWSLTFSLTLPSQAPAPPQRTGPRYKEKFQALREKFDQVNAQHDEYQRDLELANARIRKLQAENDLLLDAISITIPATPSLMHLIRPSPTGTSSSMPTTSCTHPPPPYPPPVPMNGHGYDHANGRYRDLDREYDRSEMDPVDRSNDPSPHGSSVNGRPS